MKQLTERETFATALAHLVARGCVLANAPWISRKLLQATVSIDERPYVSRGLDALLDLGMLSTRGEHIGMSPEGNIYLAFVVKVLDRSPEVQFDAQTDPALARMLAGIQADERLALPKPIEVVQTLPPRLEDRPLATRTQRAVAWLLMLATVLITIVFLLR